MFSEKSPLQRWKCPRCPPQMEWIALADNNQENMSWDNFCNRVWVQTTNIWSGKDGYGLQGLQGEEDRDRGRVEDVCESHCDDVKYHLIKRTLLVSDSQNVCLVQRLKITRVAEGEVEEGLAKDVKCQLVICLPTLLWCLFVPTLLWCLFVPTAFFLCGHSCSVDQINCHGQGRSFLA